MLLAVAVTTVVSASLLTIAFLDNAYGDHAGAISPKPMRGTATALQRERAAQDPDVERFPATGRGSRAGRRSERGVPARIAGRAN